MSEHVATCAALNLVCLYKATLPGNTPCYVTNDELELTVEENKAVYQKHQPIFGQSTISIVEQTIPSLTQHQGMNDTVKWEIFSYSYSFNIAKLNIAS